MKKILAIFCIFFCSLTVFAQTSTTNKDSQNLTEVITEKGDIFTLTIQYTQTLDEAFFIYSIPSALFEQGQAMKVIRERVQTFKKEHSYYFYTYIGADVTKYDNENELALYISHFKFFTNK